MPILQGERLKRKAIGALKGARFLLNLKVFFGYPLRSEDERQEGRDKLNDINNTVLQLKALGSNETVLKSPEALLQWTPLENNKTLTELLNRHRVRHKAQHRTTSLNILLHALGIKAIVDQPPKERVSHNGSKPTATVLPQTDKAQSPEPSPILKLGRGPFRHVLSFLSDRDVSIFAQTSKASQQKTKEELDPTSVRRFLHEVAYAKEPAMIKAAILNNPNLLLAYGTTQDPKGRVIRKKTALQIALANLDPEMATMIWDLFRDEKVIQALKVGPEILEAERVRQYEEQFPEPPTIEDTTFKFAPLIDALSNPDATAEINTLLARKGNLEGLPETALTKALKSFWRDFPEDGFPKQQTGFFFPYGDYLASENLFDTHYDGWGGYDSPRNNLFARFIIGGFHRRADARLAQILSFSLYDAVVEKKTVPRTFKFQYADGRFFDFCRGPRAGFGHEYYCGAGRCRSGAVRLPLAPWTGVLSIFFQQTLSRLPAYLPTANRDAPPRESVKPF